MEYECKYCVELYPTKWLLKLHESVCMKRKEPVTSITIKLTTYNYLIKEKGTKTWDQFLTDLLLTKRLR